MNQQRLTQVILAPIVSEKSNVLAEKRNQMTFKVLDKLQPNLKSKLLLSCCRCSSCFCNYRYY